MQSFDFESLFQTGMVTAAVLAGPLLLIATLSGLAVAIVQAATQIQEQSLPQTIKIIVIVLMLVVFGERLSAPLLEFTKQQFSHLEGAAR